MKILKLGKLALLSALSLFCSKSLCGQEYCLPCDSGYFIFGEFLYMKPYLDELDYGVAQTITVDSFTPEFILSVGAEEVGVDFEWTPGCRVGIGYLGCGGWDLSLVWMRLYSRAKGSYSGGDAEGSPPSGFLNIQWFYDTLGGLADGATASWNLHFNTLDLILGKEFGIGSGFVLHPYMGLKGAFIGQKYDINYNAVFQYTLLSSPGFLFTDTSIYQTTNFNAGGVCLGGDFAWNIRRGWSIWSHVSASLLYGQYKVVCEPNGAQLVSNGDDTPPSLGYINGRLADTFTCVRPNFQERIGIQWETLFWGRPLSFCVGYELQQWLDQNAFVNIGDLQDFTTLSSNGSVVGAVGSGVIQSVNGNLTFQGLFAQIGLVF